MSVESSEPERSGRGLDSVRWTELEGRQALSAWRSSGLSLALWCEREGVGYERLRRWKRKLEGSPQSTKKASRLSEHGDVVPGFAKVSMRSSSGPTRYRVRLPSGVVVEWDGPVEWNELEQVLRVVERLG